MALEKIEYSAYDRVHPKVAEHFHGYPLERLWYLLFDYNRRSLGPAGFDKAIINGHEYERGYMKGMFSGFNYVLGTIDVPLSLDYLRVLHDVSVSAVVEPLQSLFDSKLRMIQKHTKGYRKEQGAKFGLAAKGLCRNVSLDGFKELRKKIRGGDNYFRIIFDDDYHSSILPEALDRAVESDEELYARVCSEDKAEIVTFDRGSAVVLDRVSNIIDKFNADISASETVEDEKIMAIAEFAHELVLAHPFPDGNCRTALLLLNKLLLQQNLSPTIIENPNIMGAFSVAELYNEIKKGQNVFKEQKNHNPSEDEKITVIAEYIHELMLTDPFYKENWSDALLLLNKLLLQQNLSPIIIENFNIIEVPSVAKICGEIKKEQNIFREQKNSHLRASSHVNQQTENEDSVMYLKGNPNVAALLVHEAAACLTSWSRTNIGDRNQAVDLLSKDLCANNPTLSATQVNAKGQEITEKVFNATYKRGSLEFFSSGPMLSQVMGSVGHGKLGEATHMVFGGNQYGIDCTKLDNSNHQKPTYAQSSSLHRY